MSNSSTPSRKRIKVSWVWKHFKVVNKSSTNEDGDKVDEQKAICLYLNECECKGEFKYTKNTTTLANHLRKCHGDKLDDETRQSKITEFWKSKNRNACLDIAEMCCRNGFSFRAISDCRFIKQQLRAKYQISIESPNTVREYVIEFGRFVISKQREYLIDRKSECMKFYLIVDEAKLGNNLKVLGIKLRTPSGLTIDMGVIKLGIRSRAPDIVECIKRKLEVYGLNLDDILVYISDGCSTMKLVSTLIGAVHQICYAHWIQLAINDNIYVKKNKNNDANDQTDANSEIGDATSEIEDATSEIEDATSEIEDATSEIEDELANSEIEDELANGEIEDEHANSQIEDEDGNFVDEPLDDLFYFLFNDDGINNSNDELELNQHFADLIDKVRKVSKWFRSSAARLNTLKKYTSKTLIQDCQIKWKSLYDMLVRFDELTGSIEKAFVDLKDSKEIKRIYNKINQRTLKSIINSMEILNDATNELSKEDCLLEEAVIAVEAALELLKEDNTELSRKLFKSIEKRKPNYEGVHYQIYKVLTDQTYDCAQMDVVDDIDKLYKKLIKPPSPEVIIEEQSVSSSPVIEITSSDQPSPTMRTEQPSSTMQTERPSSTNNQTKSRFQNRISSLKFKLSNQPVNISDTFKDKIRIDLDIFKKNGILSEELALVLNFVRKIPATSVTIERLFSIANFLCNKYRNRFDSEMLNYILILRSYFKQSELLFH